jgi:Skp family chaperone for outer membrane proteins
MTRWSVFAAVAVAMIGAAFVTGAAVPYKPVRPPAEGKGEDPKQVVVVGQKTGYFNLAKVMREYKRAKTAVTRLNARKDRLTANLIGLRNMHLAVQAMVAKEPDPRKKTELAEGLVLLGRQMEDTDREINKILNNKASFIIVELHDEMKAVVAAVARDNALMSVLAYPDAVTPEEAENPMIKEMKLKVPAAYPFFVDPSVDYTDEILRRLNEKYDAENDN